MSSLLCVRTFKPERSNFLVAIYMSDLPGRFLTPATTLRLSLWIFPLSGRESVELANGHTNFPIRIRRLNRAEDPGSTLPQLMVGNLVERPREQVMGFLSLYPIWVTSSMGATRDSPTQEGTPREFNNIRSERYSLSSSRCPLFGMRDANGMKCHRVSCTAPLSWESDVE